MRVLFLTHSYPRESGDAAGSFLLRLARALAHEDIEVAVVAPGARGLSARDEIDGIPVERFRYAPRRYETLAYTGNMAEQVRASWSARFAMVGFLGAECRAANRAASEWTPDVVHAHWWFPSGLVGSWMSQLEQRPLVTTLHGTDVRLARSLSFARPAFRKVLRASAVTTAVSHWLASEVASIVSAPRPLVAPMPVATELFSPSGNREGNRLLYVGRLTTQKNVDVLIEALSRMTQRASLDIVGDGDQRVTLESLVAARGLRDRVTFHGAVPQPSLPEFYRRATAVVIPSIDEGLGLVAVEAQLCETPVVASESGGLVDVIHHDRTGVLVPPLDADALARALDALLADPARRQALGAAGRLSALATFAPESAARRYAAIYRDAIANHAS